MLQTIGSFFASLGFGIVAIIGINLGTEEPSYQTVASLGDDIEIRRYGPRIAAETTVADGTADPSRAGFEILAGYIFGGNRQQQPIPMTTPVEIEPRAERLAMTAPVAESGAAGGLRMRFFMPQGRTLDNLPQPTDPRVTLVALPGSLVAALRFSGLSDKVNSAEIARLRLALKGSGWVEAGPPTAFYYNPPWTLPFLRRNEVVIPVTSGDQGLSGGSPNATR